jgi:hypothetical protein
VCFDNGSDPGTEQPLPKTNQASEKIATNKLFGVSDITGGAQL